MNRDPKPSDLPPEPPPRWRSPSDDFVLRPTSGWDPDEDGEPLSLMPLEPETAEARDRIHGNPPPPILSNPPVTHSDLPPFQLSLRQLLFGMTCIALALAMVQAFAPQYIAGTLGIVAFGVFWGVHLYQPARHEPYAVAWGLIVLYIVMSGVALMRS
jgi:hypothetical protein